MTRATSNIIIFFFMALLLTLSFTLWTALPIPPPANGFIHSLYIPFSGLDDGFEEHNPFFRVLPGFVLLGSLFSYCLHVLLLINLDRLGTRSARIAGLVFFLTLPLPCWWGCLLLHADPENMAVFLILIFMLLALMPGVIVYSLPSTLPGTFPLLLHYLLIPLLFVAKHNLSFFLSWRTPDAALVALLLLQSVMLFTLVFFVYLPLCAYLFPHHRRLRELWRPAALPYLGTGLKPVQSFKPAPIPLASEDEY